MSGANEWYTAPEYHGNNAPRPATMQAFTTRLMKELAPRGRRGFGYVMATTLLVTFGGAAAPADRAE
jgi:hypothetical protein